MSGFVPRTPGGGVPGPEHPGRVQDDLSREDRLLRWEVRAARWRATELARECFPGPVRTSLSALRTRGEIRGLLRLEVPFSGLEDHRTREARFLASAGADPVLSRVPLVYVLGPGAL